MAKNKEVMSVSIAPNLHVEVKNLAKRKDMKVSPCIAFIIDKYIEMGFEEDPIVVGEHDDEGMPNLVIRIPSTYKEDKSALKTYLFEQVEKALEQI